MKNAIDPIGNIRSIRGMENGIRPIGGKSDEASQGGISFKDALSSAIDTFNNLQSNANRMTQKLAAGEVEDLHEVMIAIEQVNIGLQLTMQIRNKVIEAYQEIMRMQI